MTNNYFSPQLRPKTRSLASALRCGVRKTGEKTMRKIFPTIVFAIVFITNLTIVSAQTSVFTTGLQGPTKLVTAGQSHLLVAETGGAAANSGRISLVDRSTGVRRTLVDGLPSAFNQ